MKNSSEIKINICERLHGLNKRKVKHKIIILLKAKKTIMVL